MAKKQTPPVIGSPTVSPEQGIKLINSLIEKGTALVGKSELVTDNDINPWEALLEDYIGRAFGTNSPNLNKAIDAGRISVGMKQIVVIAIFVSWAAFAKSKLDGSISVKGKAESEYSTLAKITLQEATKLVYEVEILEANRNKKEVLIDAGNEKVLEVKD